MQLEKVVSFDGLIKSCLIEDNYDFQIDLLRTFTIRCIITKRSCEIDHC